MSSDHTPITLDDAGIDEAERQEILAQIEHVVDDSRIPESVPKTSGGKRGVGLPIVINILAAAAVVGAFFAASWLSQRREENMSVASREYASAEARLIAEIKRESEAQIQQKDVEIQRIQSELAQLDAERERLSEGIDEEIERREAELRQTLERQMSLERNRLEALGRSGSEIETRLTDLEAQLRSEQQSEIEAFRAEAEAELAEKQAEIDRTAALTQQVLDEARIERERLTDEADVREEELIARYEAEKEVLSERTSAAEDELARIENARRQEALISDQIIGTYAVIEQRLATGDYELAKQDLEMLESILFDPRISRVPVIAQRRNTDLFLIEALGTLVELQVSGQEQEETNSIIAASEQLSTIRALITRGDDAYQAGDMPTAVARYRESTRTLPSVRRAVERIDQIETQEIDDRVEAHIARGDALLQSERLEDARAAYREAVSTALRGDLADSALESVVVTSDAILEQRGAELLADQAGFQSIISARESRIAALEQQVASQSASIESLEAIVQSRDVRVSKLEATEDQLEARIVELTRTLEQTRIERNAANAALDSARSTLAAARGNLETVQAELLERDSTVQLLTEDLDAANTRIDSQAAAISDLNDQLSDALEEAALFELESSNREAEMAQTEERYRAAQVDSEILAEELHAASDRDEQLGASERDLSDARDEIRRLETEVSQLRIEVDRATRPLLDDESLAERYDATYDEIYGIVTGGVSGVAQAYTQASEVFDRALEDIVGEVFPGIASLRSRILNGLVAVERLEGEVSGRRAALNEILRYLSYLEAGDGASLAQQIAFEALESKELLYKRVFDRIDEALGRSSGLVELGSVETAGASSIRVTIQDGVYSAIESGASVMVKRIGADGALRTVAVGVISAIESVTESGVPAVINVEITRMLDETPPIEGDTVILDDPR